MSFAVDALPQFDRDLARILVIGSGGLFESDADGRPPGSEVIAEPGGFG
jgi:hypothetical protein